MNYFFIWTAAAAVASFIPGSAGVSNACVKCSGSTDDACGLTNGLGGLPSDSPINCPAGFCYTWVKALPGQESPSVERGCGALSCSNLQAEFAKDPRQCENGNLKVFTEGAFNQTRSFVSRPDSQTPGVSNSVNYCNDGNSCNSGRIQTLDYKLNGGQHTEGASVGVAAAAAPAGFNGQYPAPSSCIVCTGRASEPCGMKYQNAAAAIQRTSCDQGYCFTVVTVSRGDEPYVQRGCGGVLCSDMPGVVGISDMCDTNHKIRLVTDDQYFNQSRSFSASNGHAGTLQYCKNGDNCNVGAIADRMYALKNYYFINTSLALVPATLVTLLSAALVLTLAF